MSLLALSLNNLPYIGSNLIDLRYSYSYEEIALLIHGYGILGRYIYFLSSLILDSLFPFFYVSFFGCIILLLIKSYQKLEYFILVPLLTGAIDILENIQIMSLLFWYPEISHSSVVLSSYTTLLKHNFVWLQFIVLFISICVGIYSYLVGKKLISY